MSERDAVSKGIEFLCGDGRVGYVGKPVGVLLCCSVVEPDVVALRVGRAEVECYVVKIC